MINRESYKNRVCNAFARSRAVCLLGPRQCGKSTLAHEIAHLRGAEYFDLEDSEDEARLSNPKLTLERYTGLIVIDEVQRMPELFSTLRVMIDKSAGKLSKVNLETPDVRSYTIENHRAFLALLIKAMRPYPSPRIP